MPERHQRALAEHGDDFLIDVPMLGAGTMIDPGYRLDAAAAFGRTAPLIVEIGSGGGDCVVAAAAQMPDTDFLAVEVWRPGVAHTITKALAADVTNLRLICADAAQALPTMLPPSSVAEIWTFFPDPWPKAKHHKRRLVQPEFASAVSTLLVRGGTWRLATDWADYAWQIRDVVEACPTLINDHAGRLADEGDPHVDPRGAHGGFAPRFAGRAMTRFERKGLRADRVIRDVAAHTATTDE